jgi:type II secretory pathway pseudopilin PulG
MHIHVPKPLHGWRAFAGEVGIIVLGVLIALGAGQAVERINERGEVHEARQNVVAEVEQNLDVFRRRAEIQPCIDRRLGEIEQLIRSGPRPLPRPLWIGRPQIYEFYTQRWDTASAGGRTSLLAPEQQASLALFYSRFAASEQAQDLEQLAWARLRSLEVLSSLNAETTKDMIEALEEARYANWRIRTNGAQAQILAEKAGYKARDLGLPPSAETVCFPLGTTRADAMKIVLARRGARLGFEP